MLEFPCRHEKCTNSVIFRQTHKFARHFFNTNIMYLKASAGIKFQLFWRKMGGSQNGPLIDSDVGVEDIKGSSRLKILDAIICCITNLHGVESLLPPP